MISVGKEGKVLFSPKKSILSNKFTGEREKYTVFTNILRGEKDLRGENDYFHHLKRYWVRVCGAGKGREEGNVYKYKYSLVLYVILLINVRRGGIYFPHTLYPLLLLWLL